MNVILIGFTSSGKTSVGKIVAQKLGVAFHDLDDEIEWLHLAEKAHLLKCREIYSQYGRECFAELETRAIENLQKLEKTVLSTGGGVVLTPRNLSLLSNMGTAVYLRVRPEEVLNRMKTKGLPAYLEGKNPLEEIKNEWDRRDPLYRSLAKIEIDTTNMTAEEAADAVLQELPFSEGQENSSISKGAGE